MARIYYTKELEHYKFYISEGPLTASATLLNAEGDCTTITKSTIIEGLDAAGVDASVLRLMQGIKARIEHECEEAQA